jgi:hypothetical protein
VASALATCYGAREGEEYEAALTATVAAGDHWFAFADYRLLVDRTGGQPVLLTHAVLLRIEMRY